jgi:integrase/recombinase XerD
LEQAVKQAKTFDSKELKTIFAVVAARRHGVRDRAIFALSFYAGLRAHEIASLTVGNVLGADGRVVSEILLLPSQTKGKLGRKVFVSEKLRKELERYRPAYGSKWNSERALFLTQKRNPFTANAMSHLFSAIYKEAGVVGASSHSGRRTFITNLAAKGVSVRVLAALAGHASISTTQRYIDVNDNQLRAAVELV